VHDPWNLLAVADESISIDSEGGRGQWTTNHWPKTLYTTRKYHLSLSQKGLSRLSEPDESVDEARTLILVDSKTADGPIEPPIIVHLPPRPAPKSEPVSEAHLYLSPELAAGKGNHSMVYFAEWEVPRSMVIPPTLCHSCVLEDVSDILKEQDGEDGSKAAPEWKEKKSYIKTTKDIRDPIYYSLIGEEELGDSNKTKGSDQSGTDGKVYVSGEAEISHSIEIEGPVRHIHTRVQWRSPDDPCDLNCKHIIAGQSIHPRTARVRVTAKLSLMGDRHLEREAGNYQAFPNHFFEHWNGYNILPPLHDPTPVGAVVPQFYGFYRPEAEDKGHSDVEMKSEGSESSDEECGSKPSNYLSPILLLEDCGTPVDPELLNIDDKFVNFLFLGSD
jgi:hypothetical protein